jgi:Sulfotransferase family
VDFVLAHPRSGTELLARLLNAGGERVAGHEALIDLSGGLDFLAAASEHYAGRRSDEEIRRFFDRYRGAGVAIDSNWKLAWVIGPLVANFPEAAFIHLVRDPRDTIRSCVELDYYGDTRFDDEVENLWYRTLPEVRAPGWAAMDAFERNCAFWAESQRQILRLEGRPRYRRVRLEDLASPPVLERLFAALGLPLPPGERLEEVRRTRGNEKRAIKEMVARRHGPLGPFAGWTRRQREIFANHCAELAARLGY